MTWNYRDDEETQGDNREKGVPQSCGRAEDLRKQFEKKARLWHGFRFLALFCVRLSTLYV